MKMIQTRVKKNKDKPPKHNFEAKKKKKKLSYRIIYISYLKTSKQFSIHYFW